MQGELHPSTSRSGYSVRNNKNQPDNRRINFKVVGKSAANSPYHTIFVTAIKATFHFTDSLTDCNRIIKRLYNRYNDRMNSLYLVFRLAKGVFSAIRFWIETGH